MTKFYELISCFVKINHKYEIYYAKVWYDI